MRIITSGFCLAVALALVARPCLGSIDLTFADASGTINGAFYQQIDSQSTGTGVIDSFVRITGNSLMKEAYNTTVNKVLDNGNPNNFNHSITLGEVPLVLAPNGVASREFLLDINENSNAKGDQFLSLDDVQIFVGGTANASFDTFTADVLNHDGTLVYRMDDAPDGPTWAALDFQLNSGSGSGDMFLYVPESAFAGFGDSDIVTLYSKFGEQGVVSGDPTLPDGIYSQSDGFEEWAVRVGVVPIPEPVSLLIWAGLGVVVGGFNLRKWLS